MTLLGKSGRVDLVGSEIDASQQVALHFYEALPIKYSELLHPPKGGRIARKLCELIKTHLVEKDHSLHPTHAHALWRPSKTLDYDLIFTPFYHKKGGCQPSKPNSPQILTKTPNNWRFFVYLEKTEGVGHRPKPEKPAIAHNWIPRHIPDLEKPDGHVDVEKTGWRQFKQPPGGSKVITLHLRTQCFNATM